MPELQVINSLNAKRQEIEAHIGSLERDLEQVRCDLSAILAAIRVFLAEGPRVTAYVNLAKLFPRIRPIPLLGGLYHHYVRI